MIKSLTIVVLNYNGSEDTIECLESLDRVQTKYLFRIVVLDNDSTIEQYEQIERYCKIKDDFVIQGLEKFYIDEEKNKYLLRATENYGFAKGNNEIIKRFMDISDYVLLLNNDTEVDYLFIEKMLNFLYKNPDVKYASCRINNYFQKDLLWNCGGFYPFWINRHAYTEKELKNKGKIIKTPYITGCALFLETKSLKYYGMLSEDFFFGEEDFNFGWRMKKAGIIGACLNETLVYHKISQSSARSGNKVGKMAGYYSNRIIDMHKLYNPLVWHLWKPIMKLFIVYTCKRNQGMKFNEIAQVMKLIKKYENNSKLTKEDCLSMWRF